MSEKKHNPFKLRDFVGVDPDQVTRLSGIGIKHTNQMLTVGRTPESRKKLARQAGIPVEAVVELVKLSDLARLPGVKGIRARLYYACGVDTVAKLAAFEPEALLELTAEFVRSSGFAGIPPLPKEVSSTIAKARTLPNLVEW